MPLPMRLRKPKNNTRDPRPLEPKSILASRGYCLKRVWNEKKCAEKVKTLYADLTELG